MRQIIILLLLGALILSACSVDKGEITQNEDTPAVSENTENESAIDSDSSNEETEVIEDEIKRPTDEELMLSEDEAAPRVQEFYRGLTPEGMTPEAVTARLVEHYNAWAATYVKDVPGLEQKYVDYIVDERNDPDVTWCDKQAVTVSEAHGYGMLILVNMANIDGTRSLIYQRDFDDFVRFYNYHRSTYNPTLMCWQMITYGYDEQGNGEVTQIINSPEGASCATDGDLDIAYSLILADRVWGSDGEFDYMGMARRYANAIMETLISEDGRILIADWVQESEHHQHLTRSSDILVRNLYAFQEIDTDNADRWQQVIDVAAEMVNTLHTEHSGGTGLMPDFITNNDGTYAPVSGYVLEDSYDGDYNYNACRTPWRIGQYALYTEDTSYDQYLADFAAWSKEVTGGDPANYSPGYMIVSGTPGDPIPERTWSDMCFTAPLIVPAALSGDAEWYNALYNYLDSTPVDAETYFGNIIKLQALIDATGQSLN